MTQESVEIISAEPAWETSREESGNFKEVRLSVNCVFELPVYLYLLIRFRRVEEELCKVLGIFLY